MPSVDCCEYDNEHLDSRKKKTGIFSANFAGILVCGTRKISTETDVVTNYRICFRCVHFDILKT